MRVNEHRFPRRIVGVGLMCSSAGWLMQQLPPEFEAHQYGRPTLVAGGVLITAAILWYIRASSGSNRMVGKWSRKLRRNGGTASVLDILRVSSSWAMRRRATVLRPSLRELTWSQRLLTPVRTFATPIARVGLLRLWSPVEDVTLRIGGPRTGKSGELACRIVDAPGAVLVTSTRTDLYELTSPLRARRGPVLVFNPSNLGGIASTVKFSPLTGCRSVRVAVDRASDLIAPAPAGSEAERWDAQARRALAVLMHAAALGGRSMRDVLTWTADPVGAEKTIMRLLGESSEAATMREFARQFIGTNERTRTSITSSVMPALGWLMDAHAAGVADVSDGGVFDVEEFLDLSGTLYLLGAEDGVTAPLVGALTAEIARSARTIASMQPAGRLDPALTIALDEAALICPVPLDRWTADMGGRNITLHIAAQSRAQLRQRWGDNGAGIILNNAGTLLVFGGARDPDDLAAFSALSGERDEVVETLDPDGEVVSTTTRRIPVLSGAALANLPAQHAMVVRRGMAVSVGRTPLAWKRRDVRRSLRAARRASGPVTAPAPSAQETNA